MRKLLPILLILSLLVGCAPKEASAQKSLFCMDTVMDLQIWGKDCQEALQALEAMLLELEMTWSVSDQNSLLSALNRGEGKPNGEQQAFMEKVMELHSRTNGAFDPRLHHVVALWGFYDKNYRVPEPQELALALQDEAWDMGAVVKGYAGLLATQILDRYEVSRAILNLGGNIQTYGHKADGTDWNIGIQDPAGEGYVGTLAVSGAMAVVTSGDYQRYFIEDDRLYHHILDPKTGIPVNNGINSVTVICADGTVADALSTALFVMGLEDALRLWQRSEDFEAVFLMKNGTIYATEGVKLSGCEFEVVKREK